MKRLIILFANNHMTLEADEQYIQHAFDIFDSESDTEMPPVGFFGLSATWKWSLVIGMYVVDGPSPAERIALATERQVREGMERPSRW